MEFNYSLRLMKCKIPVETCCCSGVTKHDKLNFVVPLCLGPYLQQLDSPSVYSQVAYV